jgi:hypothetical protein
MTAAMEKLVDENPLLAFYRETLAGAYLRRGEALLRLGKLVRATAALEKFITNASSPRRSNCSNRPPSKSNSAAEKPLLYTARFCRS